MTSDSLSYHRIEGKTYTLFGESDSTEDFYRVLSSLADMILEENEIEPVLETIRKYSSRKRLLRKLINTEEQDSLISFILKVIHERLKPYTRKTGEHLRHIPLRKFRDRRLATSEEQYHLYMLEIELTNRLNRATFLATARKISLQPYCLQDFSVSCKAKKTDFDVQCRHCSKNCYQNSASRLLKKQNVEPYIWMGASIKKAAKEAYMNKQTFGILGIACIPELVAGMRRCTKYNIPVIGLPLNANRCKRWFGEFHPNSIDLEKLKHLLSPD